MRLSPPKMTWVICVMILLAIWITCRTPTNSIVECSDGQFEPEIKALRSYLDTIDFATSENWHLFPLETGPADSLKRLGLPVHGRWVTTWVNQTAYDYIKQSFSIAETTPLDFPCGSFIVKDNFRSAPDATSIDVNQRKKMVRTVLYKPDPSYNYCVSGHLSPYNGQDCYGGDWFYAFYFLDTSNTFFQEMNDSVNQNVAAFCVNCHAPAYNNDYVRTLQSERHPYAQPASQSYCDQLIEEGANIQDLSAQENLIRSLDTFSPPSLTLTLPPDVPTDPTLVASSSHGAIKAQLMFDNFGWQTFIALNWPNKLPENGQPRRGEADSSVTFTENQNRPTVWETFKPTFEVFQAGDEDWNPADQPWNQVQPCPEGIDCDCNGELVLTMTSKTRDVPNETGQAFAGSFGYLVDRNRELVRYEVLFNRTEFEYLIEDDRAATNRLTPSGPERAGQLDQISFPDNRTDTRWGTGSIEIKSAWKKVCVGARCNYADGSTLKEAKKKFLIRQLLVYDEVNDRCYRDTMALIGLHIVRKTHYAPQWVWMTFEHKDNVPAYGQQQEATFFDPACALPPDEKCWNLPFLDPTPYRVCCPNVDLNRFYQGWQDQPNQLTRLDPIEPQAAYLNKIYTGLLASMGSVFANYILVSTQWPLHGRNAEGQVNVVNCADNGSAVDCFTMKPRFLRNTVIESYMSTYCSTEGQNQQLSNRSCMSCHGSAGNDFSYIWLDAVSQRVPLQ